MPRLASGGPGLAVSRDHTLVAVAAGGRVTLYATDGRRELGAAELPAGEETDLIFTGAGRLVSFTRTADSTIARSWEAPALKPVAQLELIGRVRPTPIVGERMLVMADGGLEPRVVTALPKLLIAEPIALREPVQFAVAAPEERLLVAAREQLECWDPVRRQAMFRLNLPLTRPKLAGFAARERLLWIGSGGMPGGIDVFRFSDGRMVLRIDLGKRLHAADGHAESPRLVVAAIADGEGHTPSLIEFDLQLQERRPLKLEVPAEAFCVVESAEPALVTAGAGGVQWLALPAVMTTADRRTAAKAPARASAPEPRPLPPNAAKAAAAAAAARAATPAWRARLSGSGEEAAPGSPPEPAAGGAEAAAERMRRPTDQPSQAASPIRAALNRNAGPDRAESPNRAGLPGGKESAPPPDPRAETAARASAETAPAPSAHEAAPAPSAHEAAGDATALDAGDDSVDRRADADDAADRQDGDDFTETAADWRDVLVDWGRAALASPGRAAPQPADDASPLGDIAARFGLDQAGACALALLYASWLLGDGRTGLDAARLARAVAAALGAEPGDPLGWNEALGGGTLIASGLARAAFGRIRLRAVAGRFLDGAAPRVAIAHAASHEPAEPSAGTWRIDAALRPLDALPQLVADRLGRDVARIELAARASRRPPPAVVEARLHDAVPLLVPGGAPPAEWLPLPGDPLLLVLVADEDSAFADLPALAID